jgi:hypothetical protein
MFHLVISSKSHYDDDISDRKKKREKKSVKLLFKGFIPAIKIPRFCLI